MLGNRNEIYLCPQCRKDFARFMRREYPDDIAAQIDELIKENDELMYYAKDKYYEVLFITKKAQDIIAKTIDSFTEDDDLKRNLAKLEASKAKQRLEDWIKEQEEAENE